MAEVGRPTKCTPEILEAARDYVNACPDLLPSVAGLAVHLDVSRKTIYNWAEDEGGEFLHIYERLMAVQENKLLSGGLSGDFNATITKAVLTKHGYHDKQDNTHSGPDGKPIQTETAWSILPVTTKPNAANTTARQTASADPDPQAD